MTESSETELTELNIYHGQGNILDAREKITKIIQKHLVTINNKNIFKITKVVTYKLKVNR